MKLSVEKAWECALKSQTGVHRPVDLARAHGLSAQAVRNYEQAGVIPPAARTESGYRVYTDDHVTALSAYLGLIPGYGYKSAGIIMRAALRGDDEAALATISAAHVQLQRDRETVTRVAAAVLTLAEAPAGTGTGGSLTVGVLAHRLGVTAATLRKWERAGILTPARSRMARVYSPDDVRDAELAHLLRRGHYPLSHIAAVIAQVRAAGGPGPLAASIGQWRERLTARGRAMLTGSARLADFLDRPRTHDDRPQTHGDQPGAHDDRPRTHDAPPVGVTGGASSISDQRGKSR